MKYNLIAIYIAHLFEKEVIPYTETNCPDLDIKPFKKRLKQEYKAMVKRTPGVGSMKENPLSVVMYMACFGLSYYKAGQGKISEDHFAGMIQAVCKSETMKKFYKGRYVFDEKNIAKYDKIHENSKKRKYPMDWVGEFRYDPSVPEFYLTYRECGICKLAKQENLSFLVKHMCLMDYPAIEYMKGKLLRSKTLGKGDECCDFHVVKAEGE
ncbi:MAG: L-2-amino-thiazoline-4-carboxylic acid hydrolase [Bacilli bacterium]|nr:L-2-amino-thiazoline-4-carboxylic acid hydrolase [Bacilli bacterium]